MLTNSPKDTETVDEHLSAVRALANWLEHEGGNQRIPRAIAMLVASTEAALREGRSPPAAEVESLVQEYFDAHGGSLKGVPAGRWLQRPKVEAWWRAREDQIRQACRRTESKWVPILGSKPGGGRGNSTEYAIAFAPLNEDVEPSAPEGARRSGGTGSIQYEVEPAKTARWVGWLSSAPQFHVRSWRGWTLISMLCVAFAWVVLALVLTGFSMWSDRPVSGRDVVTLAVIASIGWLLWTMLFRSICLLPMERVTVVPIVMLHDTQLHAQFRLTRNSERRSPGSWFSVVRHWGTCPLCSGDVDVHSGGDAFPGRLVGRCADSPLEHVYTFDPVTLTGRSLRVGTSDDRRRWERETP